MGYDMKRLIYIESVVLVGLVLLFAAAAYQRNLVWKDDLTLWSDIVKKSPNKARPYNNLGVALNDKGLAEKAIIEIKKALMLKPNFVNARVSLGNAYFNKGLPDMAIVEYRNALRLKPDYAGVYVNIGNIYIKKGLIDKAIDAYTETLRLKPDNVRARVNLASAYGLKGFTEEAITEYKIALELESDNPDIHYNLGLAYERLAKSNEQRWLIEQAIKEYRRTLMLNPDDLQAREGLARLVSEGRLQKKEGSGS